MAWVRVDDKFSRGPKVRRAALALGGKRPRRRILAAWLDAMSYCNLNLTDGFIPDYEVAEFDDEHPVDVFRAMGHGDPTLGPIVERDDARGGWQFRNYATYQPTKADVESKLDRDRERKRQFREASAKRPRGQNSESVNVRAESAPTDPDRPGPSRTQDLKDQEPRADAPQARPLRMALHSISDLRSHLRAACHGLIESGDAQYGPDDAHQSVNLFDQLKHIAARDLRIADYDGRAIQKIIDAVLNVRVRRSA